MELKLRLSNFLTFALMLKYLNAQFVSNNVVSDFNNEVRLSCDQTGTLRWFKKPNIQLNDIGNPYDTTLYRIETNTLILLKANWTDVGREMYYAAIIPELTKGCSFNVYLFQPKPSGEFTSVNTIDKDNQSPDIKITFSTQVNTVPLEVNWDVVFPFYFNYLYKLETLPLNQLTINGSVIPAADCRSNSSRTNCLFANYTLLLPKCTKGTDIIIGYTFDNAQLYSTNIATFYTLRFTFDYPPQVITERVNQYVKDTNENVTLVCETYTECGTPISYRWKRNKAPLVNFTDKIINIFPNLTSTTDSVTFSCEPVSSALSLTSSTAFIVSVKTGLAAWQIALIVIGCVLGLALIIVSIVLIWKFCIKSSSSATISS